MISLLLRLLARLAGLRLAVFDGAKKLLVTSQAALEEERQCQQSKLHLEDLS